MNSAKIQKVFITLCGHYDQDKTATVRVDYNGYDYYISKRAMTAAHRRAGICEGDYLEMDDRDGMLIVED